MSIHREGGKVDDNRDRLIEIMEDAAKGETKATLRARIAALEAENARLRDRLAEALKALEPFADIAGEMFARGWDASNVAIALESPDDPHRVTAGDFFTARRVREGGKVE